KQLEKNPGSYYYNDLLTILDELPHTAPDREIVAKFKIFIEERNIVYLSGKLLAELLGELSFFPLLLVPKDIPTYLDLLIKFCFNLKFQELDDIQYEN